MPVSLTDSIDVVAGADERLTAPMTFVDDDIARLDGELSAAGHRVFGVHDQIHQHLFELSGVGPGVALRREQDW